MKRRPSTHFELELSDGTSYINVTFVTTFRAQLILKRSDWPSDITVYFLLVHFSSLVFAKTYVHFS